MDLVDRAMATLRRSVLPSVIARGGTVRVVAVEEGIAILEVRGSPGAVLPLASRIQELLGTAVPEITGVQFVGPHAEPPPAGRGERLADRVREVLDAEINPVIAAHGGRVTLVEAGRLGLEVVVGSDGALALDRRLVVRVDPGDLEASVDRLLTRSGPVDAVVAVDTPMLVLAAAVAARMGLTHNRGEAVPAAAHKATQRRPLAAADVAQPAFRILPADASTGALKQTAAEGG